MHPPSAGAPFAIGVGLNIAFVIAEVVVGFSADSLALLSDAGHNLTDVLGLLLAWGAVAVGRRRPSERFTYGLRRSSILAALLNGLLLLAAIGAIVWDAVRRFGQPAEVASGAIMAVAAVGVFVNAATAMLFMRGREHDLNVRGAFVHMAADAGVSLGVVAAGGLIRLTGWAWIDPAVSLLIAAVVLLSTWKLLAQSIGMSLDAVPSGIRLGEVETYLRGLPGVTAVHDLHVWPLGTTHTALTAHLVRPDAGTDDALLLRAAGELRERFGIAHTTLQIESRDLGGEPDDARQNDDVPPTD